MQSTSGLNDKDGISKLLIFILLIYNTDERIISIGETMETIDDDLLMEILDQYIEDKIDEFFAEHLHERFLTRGQIIQGYILPELKSLLSSYFASCC